MEQDRTESFASPLDEVLDNLPEEDAPEGLERRCLDALDEGAVAIVAVENVLRCRDVKFIKIRRPVAQAVVVQVSDGGGPVQGGLCKQ